MKIFYFSILIFIGGISSISAQTQVVDNLCHDEEFTERISVVTDFESSTLTILDKLKFRKKKYVKKHHEYFAAVDYATHDMHFVSHENMFPEWYSHPSTIRSDETGTKSFFTSQYENLPDGWTGGIKSETEHGEYIDNTRTGEKYLSQPYSQKATEAYQSWNQKVLSEGFLTKYTFYYPSNSDLEAMQSEGFDVSSTEGIIAAKNTSIIMVWDVVKKVFIRQFLESNTLVKTVKTFYQYNEEFNTNLIFSVVTITPGTFENGDCYETISYTRYSNYSDRCDDRYSDSRSDKSENEISQSDALKVYPNPANDIINITVPPTKLKTSLQISNVNGEILVQRQIVDGLSSLSLDIGEFPSGIYSITCIQGKDNYTSKFVKQ